MMNEREAVSGSVALCSWAMLIIAVLGSFLLEPGLARALDGGAVQCWASNPDPVQIQSCTERERQFGPLPAPREFATLGSDGVSAVSATQTSSAGSTGQASVDEEKERLMVNPVTGLSVASGSSYRPLTGEE